MVPAATRFARTKTALVLAAAGGVVVAAALLSQRRARPARVDDVSAAGFQLGARATSRAVLRGASDTHLAITVRAPDLATEGRPPLTLAVVLDRSGSMTGEPLDEARAAADRLIDQLGPDDRFAVVTYSSRAELLAPARAATPEARAEAKAALEGVVADGGTNISAGLALGEQALEASHLDGGLRRIVLLSDGQANAGIYDRDGLARVATDTAARGTSISAVGVGLDFDERTMTDIAVSGRGNYYFVENTAELSRMFDHELDSLGQTVAAEARLAITPAPGVELLDAYGYRTTTEGGTMFVPIADLRAGESRKVVVKVRVTAGAGAAMELARVRLTFRPRGASAPVEATTVARAEITDDAGVVTAGLRRDAVRQVEEARTAHALEQATEAYEHGDAAAAQQILEVQRQEATAAAEQTGDDELQQRIGKITTRTANGFAAAPAPMADEGRRASKDVRLDAYDLAR